MLTGTNLLHAKQHNLRIILETIRLYGPISRADVARRSQLTAQTVSNLVKHLMRRGMVVELEKSIHGRGAPSILLAVNPEGAFSVGLDLDVDHLTAVLVDMSGEVKQRLHSDLSDPSPAEAISLMSDTTHELLRMHGITVDKLWGMGVGIPGPMVAGRHGSAPYVVSPRALFAGWQDVHLAEELHQKLGLPVFIENNATAAAVGEHWYGAGRHMSTFFYVYIGSGLGGGLVVQGNPFEGHSGNAGEIGYLPVPTLNGKSNGIRHIGESFNLKQLLARMRDAGESASEPDDLARLLKEQRPIFMEWLDEATQHLTEAILAVEYLLDPETTFIGGRWPEKVIEILCTRVAAELPARRIVARSPASLPRPATAGTDAAALGVATLPIYNSFAPLPRISLKRAEAQPH